MRTNARGHTGRAAEGDEWERTGEAPDAAGDGAAWQERVLVVRSPIPADPQAAGVEQRLSHAETTLAALTPPRGRGKRHITEEATLVAAMARVLTAHRVDGLLSVTWEKPGARLCAPREARDPANPRPHDPQRSPGRHHRRAPATFGLEGLGHQCGSPA